MCRIDFIRYLLLAFGSSDRFSSLNNVFTGITISGFALIFVEFLLTIPVVITWKVIFMKIFIILWIIPMVCCYILVKKKSDKIFGMLEAIHLFEVIHCPRSVTFVRSLVINMIMFVITYSTHFYYVLNNEMNFLFEMKWINVSLDQHSAITGIYPLYIMFILQVLY